MDFVQNMNQYSSPEVFGFHENANITKDQNDTNKMLDALLSTQSSGGAKSAGKKTADEMANDLAKEMEGRMPDSFDLKYAEKKFPFSKFESLNT